MAKQTFTTGQVLTAAQQNSLQANDFNQTVSVKTANYTLVAADKGTRIEFNTSGSVTCTVNSGLFDAGDTLVIQNRGAGAATVTAGTATVNTSASLVVKQYDSGVLYFVSDSSAIYFASDAADTPLTTKGDLFTFSTAADRLAVGSDGDSIVADSAASTGLAWAGNFAAGKNKIINGDFNINQRSFTSTTTSETYGFDRWVMVTSDGTCTYSTQAFTAGTAPVTGYEGTNFARLVTSGQTATSALSRLTQRIENVRTLTNQSVTISFWAKAASGTPKIAVEWQQQFGAGGSSLVNTYAGQATLSTSWARYSITVSVPSVSGKTINAGSFIAVNMYVSAGTDLNARTGSIGIQSNTFDIWGVQVEAGNVATAFQTATGTLQGEFAAACRYYQKIHGFTSNASLTTQVHAPLVFPVAMRTSPSISGSSALYVSDGTNDFTQSSTNVEFVNSNRVTSQDAQIRCQNFTGLTQWRGYMLVSTLGGDILLSAEL